MFDGKMKAITFSYDDGVTQDQRLIEIFDKYGLKCTFNLNSGLLGQSSKLKLSGRTVAQVKPDPDEVRWIYRNHEVATHTLTHPDLIGLSDDEIYRQVEEDRLALSELVGYEVVGMAYPGGSDRYDERAPRIIREKTGIRYSRNTADTGTFDLPTNLLDFCPTTSTHNGWAKVFCQADAFLALQPTTPQLFYVWGHAYEFDSDDSWGLMEEFCKKLARRDDIFYGTNREVLLSTE